VATVVISPFNVANFPEGGGHFWVYLQYALGLRQLGCEVYWLERLGRRCDSGKAAAGVAEFAGRLDRYGLGQKHILYCDRQPGHDSLKRDYINVSRSEAEAIPRGADLLLNFHYTICPDLLSMFSHTALVDIDPGLLQFWMSRGQLNVASHDLYFTMLWREGEIRCLSPNFMEGWRRL